MPSWVKYYEFLTASETYEERYVRPLSKVNDIYIGSPWKTGKTNYGTLVCQVESLQRITNKCKCDRKCKCSQNPLYSDRVIVLETDLTDRNIEWIKGLWQNKKYSINHNT
ncbi:hypothetical protein Glove_682g44 [Diversispora epigaea]|uniref:Uncharacterized protein n=1 Tax=Diversispora epigaea TaxID=1348612 RepID=A0A397G5C1_9GLOM|nr:hypothetical protein Glove_682g44 [Diversispora epigaea]